MAASSACRAGEGEKRESASRRWLRATMSLCVRRALCHTAMRSARPAMAMARKTTANKRLMLGVRSTRQDRARNLGGAPAGRRAGSGAGLVMRPPITREPEAVGQERPLPARWRALGPRCILRRPVPEPLDSLRDALAYAHSHAVVHRDIKPENIMLSGGTAVVADFGIARAVTAAGEGHHLTQTGTLIGTPAYMSPEQASGSGEVDGRSDEYSLACVVYEMLVGEPPFTGPTAQAIIARHSLDLVSPPSIVRASIPDAVEGAILRALSKVPADRYPTTALFAEALNRPSAATGAYRRATLERGLKRPPSVVWRLLPVAAVVAVLGGYFVIRSARAGRGVATSGLDPKHIAVLYFDDLSRDHSLGYLADGLTEALIDALRQVPTLTVASKNGVGLYRSSAVRLDSVARALNVGTIVAGSVDGVGGRYRVSVNLIDGASGADLGKRASFEQPIGAVLAIRDSLTRRAVEFLRVRLGEELRVREERAGTQSVAAWSLVQQGERTRKDAEARLQKDEVDAAFAAFARADSLLALAEAADPAWVEPIVQRGWIAHRRARLTSDRKRAAPWRDLALGHAA